jgi:hypothetical protein
MHSSQSLIPQQKPYENNISTALWIHKVIPFLDVFEQDRLKQTTKQFEDFVGRAEESAAIRKLTKELAFLDEILRDAKAMEARSKEAGEIFILLWKIAMVATFSAMSGLIGMLDFIVAGAAAFLSPLIFCFATLICVVFPAASIYIAFFGSDASEPNRNNDYSKLRTKLSAANRLGIFPSAISLEYLHRSFPSILPHLELTYQNKKSDLIKHQEMKKIAQHQRKAQAARTPIVVPQHLLSYVMPAALEEPQQQRPHY